jgi:hypothetical protein
MTMREMPQTRRQYHHMALLPLILMVALGIAIYTWPSEKYDVPLVRPPVAEAGSPVPETIVTLAQGQPVGDEEYFKGFLLNRGWHLAPVGDYGRFTLVGNVTNVDSSPDVANVLVRVRIANQYKELVMCHVSLAAAETKPLICSDLAHAQYTSRWSQIILQTY